MKSSYKVSLGGVLAAIAVLCMFLTGFGPFFTYLCPMFAGTLLIMVVVEISVKWAFATYAAIAILSIFTTPDKEAALLFIFLLGYYPILKSIIERLSSRVFEWIIKFLVFNISVICCYWLVINAFGMGQILEDWGKWGQYGMLIFLAMGNVVFVIYDLFLTSVIVMYTKWFRPKFLRKINK